MVPKSDEPKKNCSKLSLRPDHSCYSQFANIGIYQKPAD
jgi:hypothetical protein